MANKTLRYSLIIAVVTIWSEGKAQSFEFYGSAGWGSYSYAELKEFQDLAITSSAGLGRAIDQFPSYLTYQVGFDMRWTKWILGFEAGHGSTGGRVFYQDYSGKFSADQLVTYNAYSVAPAIIVFDKNNWMIFAGAKSSFVHHRLKIRNEVVIGTQNFYEEKDFTGFSFALQPNLGVRRYFRKIFLIATAGYELQDKAMVETNDNPRLYLINKDNEPVNLQGNGYRVTLGLGVKF